MKMLVLIALSFSVLIGCSSHHKRDELVKHEIYIDKRGELRHPISQKPLYEGDVKQYVKRIVKGFQESKKKKIVVYVHGGLNTFQHATDKAAQMLGYFEEEDAYPIFIGWQSGPFTNYFDHLLWVRNGVRRPVLGPLTSPFVLLQDVATSISRAPRATVETVFSQASLPTFTESKEEDFYGKSEAELEKASKCVRIKLHTAGDSTGSTWTWIVSMMNPIKYATAPFVDGLGTGTWSSLVRRTDLLITRDSAFEGEENSKTALEILLTQIANLGEKDGPEITLIGHSMGAIVSNNIISRYPQLKYKNIVYMGSAARIKDIEFAVVPLLLKNDDVSFYNLSLDPYNELSESHFLDSLPRGTLLVWIERYYSKISSFADRMSGNWFNIVRAADTTFPDAVKPRVHLTRFGVDEGPQEHGDFDEYKFWLNKFWTAQEVEPLD